ncbi:thioredoxin family protein [Alteriqipengyuania sp.]|uniref:thioredoxin family protein n=1 Tax=Alteriqipengyuania sp. TaxID=2800692 RepID=UPI003514D721
MTRAAALALLVAAPVLGSPVAAETSAAHPEARPFDESVSDALYAQELEQAIAQLEPGRRVLAVFGANWCHDSRALAGWLTSPGFEPLLDAHFEVVFIDVGEPQEGDGRNLDLAARFGVTGIEGTPNLLVIDSKGTLVNTPESAKGWRNAASRSEEAVYAIIASYAGEAE